MRYADDLVVLTPKRPDRELAWMKTAHASASGWRSTRKRRGSWTPGKEHFTFLGHTHFWRRGQSLPRHREEGAKAHPRRAAVENPHGRGSAWTKLVQELNLVHPRGPAVLPPGAAQAAIQAGSLRRPDSSRDGGSGSTHFAGQHGRSCMAASSTANMGSNCGTCLRLSDQQTQGARGEHRGKPYAGNPHVRFEGGPLARASRTAKLGSTQQASGLGPERSPCLGRLAHVRARIRTACACVGPSVFLARGPKPEARGPLNRPTAI